jgi:oleandomycin transport system ATP-binding protein
VRVLSGPAAIVATMSYAIQAEGLVKRFGATTALAGVDFEVARGTVLGLLGPNGSGKTTAVRILATLLQPDAGRAEVGGRDTVRQAHQVRQLIGLTGQYAAVDDNLTGHQNLLMIGRLLGLSVRHARERAAELLARFDLAEAARRPVKTYSGGMRRRLDLALSLVGRPQVLYLDEPTTGLDPQSRSELWTIVRDLVGDGTTVLLTTQYLEEADRLADVIVVLDHGTAIARGTPDALKAGLGGVVLEIRPADAGRLGTVAAVVADLATSAPEVHAGSQLVTVPMRDSALLGEVVRRLEHAGVVLTDLALRRPSLDEVFLSLTGRRTGPDGPTEEEIAV